jgi:hypothetical protein
MKTALQYTAICNWPYGMHNLNSSLMFQNLMFTINEIDRDYFKVGECVRFLFTDDGHKNYSFHKLYFS